MLRPVHFLFPVILVHTECTVGAFIYFSFVVIVHLVTLVFLLVSAQKSVICPVYKWLAAKKNKEMSWPLALATDWGPVGCKVPLAAISRNFTTALVTLRLRPAISPPAYLQSTASRPTAAEQIILGDDGDDMLEDSLAAFPNEVDFEPPISPPWPETLAKAAAHAKGLPAEAVAPAIALLCQRLADIPSVAPFSRLIRRTTDGQILSAALRGLHIPLAEDQARVSQVLAAWCNPPLLSVPLRNSEPRAVFGKMLDLVRAHTGRDCNWALLAIQFGVELINRQLGTLADLFDTSLVDSADSFAGMLADGMEKCSDAQAPSVLLHILQEKILPSGQSSSWTSGMLADYGFGSSTQSRGQGPAPVPPPQSSAPPADAPIATPSTTKFTVRAALSSGASVPWPVLLAAISAHFGTNGTVGRPSSTDVAQLFITIPKAAWDSIAAGRSSWSFPVGQGESISIASVRRDGNPFTANVPSPLGLMDLWHSYRPVEPSRRPEQKRARVEDARAASETRTPTPPTPVAPRPSADAWPPRDASAPTSAFAALFPPPAGAPYGPPMANLGPQPHPAPCHATSGPVESMGYQSIVQPLTNVYGPVDSTSWHAYATQGQPSIRGPGGLSYPTRVPSVACAPPLLQILTWALFQKYGPPSKTSFSSMQKWLSDTLHLYPTAGVDCSLVPTSGTGGTLFACLSCGSIYYQSCVRCPLCSSQDRERLRTYDGCPADAGTTLAVRQRLEWLLDVDLGPSISQLVFAIPTALLHLQAWVKCLASRCNRIKYLTGISPPIFIGRSPVVCFIAKPTWIADASSHAGFLIYLPAPDFYTLVLR